MTALGMRLALSRLMKKHHHTVQPVTIPLLTHETERAQVLTGRAATTDIDLQRQKFRRGWTFGPIHRQPYPPLYFKHDTGRGEVGIITNLQYDSDGALIITATVTCPLARRANAFSVGCTVRSFSIQNEASPEFHAVITEALIDEISLTDQPANTAALVTHRRDVCARAEFYGHAASAIERISEMITLIQKGNTHVAASG